MGPCPDCGQDATFHYCTLCRQPVKGSLRGHFKDQHRGLVNDAKGMHLDDEIDAFWADNIHEVGDDDYQCESCGETTNDPMAHIQQKHRKELIDAMEEHEDDELQFLIEEHIQTRSAGKYGFATKLISGKDWVDDADNEFDKEVHRRLQGFIDQQIKAQRTIRGREPTWEEIENAIEGHRSIEIKRMLATGEWPITMIVTDTEKGEEFNRLYFKTEGEAGDYHDMQTEYGFDPRSSHLSVEILNDNESEKVQAPAIPEDWDSDEEQERALYNAMDSLDDGGKIRLLRVHYYPQTEQITKVEIKEYDDADDYEDDVNDDPFSDPTKDIILTPETEEAAKIKYQPNAQVK